ATRRTASPASRRTLTVIEPPRGVNFSEFDRRFMTICSRRTPSASIQTGSTSTPTTWCASFCALSSVARQRRTAAATSSRGRTGDGGADQLDLSERAARDVEEVRDEPRQVLGLMRDHLASAAIVLERRRLAEDRHRGGDGPQRVAQLVAEHRQELVLRLTL